MKALEWIEDKFRKYDTPRLYCGGLAVKAYGGTRPLNDIDVFVPDVTFWPLVEALKDHIRKPAIRQCEAGWDLTYVQFVYDGMKIEIGSDDTPRIQDGTTGQWCALDIDFDDAEMRTYGECDLPVMARDKLIAYKQILAREVDLIDVAELAGG